MTVEEFKEKVESDPEWAPGWEIIDNEFDRLYPGRLPSTMPLAWFQDSEAFFQPYEHISGGGKSLHIGVESNITALLTIADTEARTQDTLYGKTEFIQPVGITESELQAQPHI